MIIRDLGTQDYTTVWHAMQEFTRTRDSDREDELWCVQHPPVFTQGQAGKPEHILDPGTIPVIQSDRGGQVTYHGPGQLIVYLLWDIQRKQIGIRDLVCLCEQSIIRTLQHYHVDAEGRRDAPGVYVNGKKIASIGLRVRRGCTFHGLAFNIDMDLEPFSRINPCGYPHLTVTDCRQSGIIDSFEAITQRVVSFLETH